MKNKNRRKFIKSVATGLAGTMVLPGLASVGGRRNDNTAIKKGFSYLDDPSEEYWHIIKEQFHFEPKLKYFNNASLGPSPVSVQEVTKKAIETLDGFPSKYMWGGWKDKKEAIRSAIASLFSVSAEEIAIIHNTTEGFNVFARSFELQPGDEIIIANHEHPSGTIPWEVWQESKGIKIIRPELPMMPESRDDIIEVYRQAITPKTKIISMCHIVNTNGMILPVKEVSEMAHKQGILVAVDGAQSAGMIPINLDHLGCDFYAASSHKWLFSPKGVGILYAKKESQPLLKPLMVAHGHTDTSIRRLENYNTRNLPEVLGLGAAIEFNNMIGAEKIGLRSVELKKYFRDKIVGNAKFKLKTPADNDLSAAIQVLEVVDKDVLEVRKKLLNEYMIDCRPMTGFGLNALRLSFAVYITKKDIDYLVGTLNNLT